MIGAGGCTSRMARSHGWGSAGVPRGCVVFLTEEGLGSKNVSQETDGSCSDLASEVPERSCCCIFLVKQVTRASSGPREGKLDHTY